MVNISFWECSVLANYKWRHVPGMLIKEDGRRRLITSIVYRLRKLVIPAGRIYRRTFIRRVKMIAVVGSFGKTTTTRAVAIALGHPISRHRGNNNGVHLAVALLSIPPWAKYRVVEVGISRKGQMAENAKLIRPDIVVVTGIGSEHGTSLGSLEQTREEKADMVRMLPETGLAVLNGDDPHVLQMHNYTNARVLTQGFDSNNDLQATHISSDLEQGGLFSISDGNTSFPVRTNLLGRAAIRPIIASLLIAAECGVDRDLSLQRLAHVPAAPERLELIKTRDGADLIVDTLKSAIETVEHALQTLEDLPAERKIVVLGEVEEPRGSLGEIYRGLGERIAKTATCLIFVGSKRVKRPLFSGARKAGMAEENMHHVKNSVSKAGELASKIVQPGDLVLIKGRSSQKMVRIALALCGEKVECRVEFCRRKPGCRSCYRLIEGYGEDVQTGAPAGQRMERDISNTAHDEQHDVGWLR